MLWLTLLAILLVSYYVIRYLLDFITIGDLPSRYVFITGCDTGFGHELALRLAGRGMPIFAGCFSAEGAAKLSEEARGLKGRLITVLVDVTKQESVDRAVEQVTKELGSNGNLCRKLWAIVNNAGVFATYGPDDWLTPREYEEALGVNTLGVIRVSQAFRGLLKKSKGRVVTIASPAGRIALATLGPYAVSKFAVVAYMDVIRNELRPFGVTCHILEPGIFRTSLLEEKAYEKRINFTFDRCSDQVKNEYGREYIDALRSAWHQFFIVRASPHTEVVTDAYMHALTAAYPRTRYVIGWDARLLWIPLSLLPLDVQDFMVNRVLPIIDGSKTPLPRCLRH